MSEPSDESTDYITFTGRSAPVSPDLEPVVQRFGVSEPSHFAHDFPEDVGEHDTILADGDQGAIDHPGRPTPVPASEIPVELLVQPLEGFTTPPTSPSNVLLQRMRKLSEGSGELGPLSHLPYHGLDDVDVPVNVPPSPFISDLGSEADGVSIDADWLGASREETIWSGCLGGELTGLDRWRREVVDEINRDLGSWAEVVESMRTELDRV